MNKFVRFAVLLILLVIALVVGLGYYEPNDVTVTRKVVVQAPANAVYERILHFGEWEKWCTLFNADTAVKITIAGEDTQPGSMLQWKGDDGATGSGYIKNTATAPNKLSYEFKLEQPGEMDADGYIGAKDSGEYAVVTWTFHKHFSFPANASLVLWDLDKYMGGELEKALNSLKTYMETKAEPIVTINQTTYEGRLVAGIRDTVAWSDISVFCGDTYNLLGRLPGASISGAPMAIYYDWDTVRHRTDMIAGLPVTDSAIALKGIVLTALPSTPALMTKHIGGYGSMQHAHNALQRRIARQGLNQGEVIEEYIKYPGNEADSSKWETNIYYLLQQ